MSAAAIARALGGRAAGPGRWLCRCPAHDDREPSCIISDAPEMSGGISVHCFAGCDWCDVKAALERLRLLDDAPNVTPALQPARDADKGDLARSLWSGRRPIEGTPAAAYLRWRGYQGPFPATLSFLPARGDHPPALIAAFTIPEEPEPGRLAVTGHVLGIHLTRLQPDGKGKAGNPAKIMLGRTIGTPIVLAPMNDSLGLAIVEGVETGLSVYEATGLGVWVAGAAGRMPALAGAVPSYTDCVTVAGEHDQAGRKGASDLTDRLEARDIHCELRFLDDAKAS